MFLRRSVARLPFASSSLEAVQLANFSSRAGGGDRGAGDSKGPTYSRGNRPSGAGNAPPSSVYRRTAETKGAMKSFFDTGASGAAGAAAGTAAGNPSQSSTPPSSTGASIWQRLKKDAGSRIMSDRPSGGQQGYGGNAGQGGGRPRYAGQGQSQGQSQGGSVPAGDRPRYRSNYSSSAPAAGGQQGGGRPGGYAGNNRFNNRGGRGGGGYVPGGAPGRQGGRRPQFNNRGGGDRRKPREDREQNFEVGEIEHSLLKDYEYFEDLFAGGGHIQSRYMDPVDTLLSEVFEESFKTRDGSVMKVMDLESESEIRRSMTHMKARPMSQLLTHSIVPDIHTAAPGTFAHQTAQYAWEAISKNPYYSEHQRNWMCNKIAKLTNRAFSFEPEKHGYNSDDQVLDPSFRYGTNNMPEEELEFEARVKMLRELETNDKGISKIMRRTRHEDVLEESLKYFVTEDVAQYFTVDQMTFEEEQAENQRKLRELQLKQGQAETDWSVEAVVDEDQL
jgi:hypothetical protein